MGCRSRAVCKFHRSRARGSGANSPARVASVPFRARHPRREFPACLVIWKGASSVHPEHRQQTRPPARPTARHLAHFRRCSQRAYSGVLPAPRPGFTGATTGIYRRHHRRHPSATDAPTVAALAQDAGHVDARLAVRAGTGAS